MRVLKGSSISLVGVCLRDFGAFFGSPLHQVEPLVILVARKRQVPHHVQVDLTRVGVYGWAALTVALCT